MEYTSQSKPRWARRKDARPQELLAAALDLFVERGYAATRLDDVAAKAGVSKGTLYLYFTNKEELFKAVVSENLLPVLDEAEGIIDAYDGHSAQLFREFILGWWERIGETSLSGITKLMLAESGNFPEVVKFYHDEVISRSNALIIRMLERGIARGEFRPIDTARAQQVIVAPVIMLMLWKHSFNACQIEPIAPHEYLECFIDLISHGLLSNAPDTTPSKRA
ncbi:MAG: TetR/AcrR family transcriptional regulator [Herminiimonas sp.]|jgi:AcrR family transcriptional regulator|nr:TetR/AcrR family transcriptional regulator [Herminiimonas sp.]